MGTHNPHSGIFFLLPLLHLNTHRCSDYPLFSLWLRRLLGQRTVCFLSEIPFALVQKKKELRPKLPVLIAEHGHTLEKDAENKGINPPFQGSDLRPEAKKLR